MAAQIGEEKTREMVASTGYCYTDHDSSTGNQNIQTHLVSQLQQFEHSSEIYNLTAGMEMVGFPPKNLDQHNENTSVLWKEYFNKPGGGASSSKPTSTSEYYSHDLTGISDTTNENFMDSSSAWNNQNRLMVDDPSLRCVFPGEGNERCLSLSLSSSNPGTTGIHQSFDLGQQDDLRFGPSSSRSVVNIQRQQQMMPQHFQIRSSKYLAPAQDLLNEFCNLGSKHSENTPRPKIQKNNEWDDENIIKKQSLYSLDLLELQKRKTKLLQLLDEVDRRYKNYCDQMKAVVSSFEAVAGNGAATVYSALASKAMSRHFRCLRDGIVGQIKATMKAMGAKDTAAPGTTRGETPRLRLLDQTLRQQKAFQQMNMMESHPWRPQRGLPERSVTVLRAWLFEHFLHPYPSDVDKHILARQTGLSRSQVSNWFINARVRLWKPMVEQMYLEELKEKEGLNDDSTTNLDENNDQLNSSRNIDEKPNHDQLIRIDSECLSSIVNNPEKNDGKKSKTLQNDQQHLSFGRVGDSSFGAMELDFSSYNHHSTGGAGAAPNYVGSSSGGGGGGGVSLTLGLHHASVGVSLAFPSASQNSLFYPRDHIEDCQTVQYSLLDSESQNLPYRNLMGAQLLHDLAG
ncbi:homeobox BEL1 homolog [Olea europaea subsp. europaea]|uniref:Homeobox BEL1 homolog n=1 Tax=Olea europaea subsp. europaea TaxID=158383 RepID=A0A8S0SMN1_OLEEU|nr:homeobox BEL1 homolog [Olea europaea subsp. europaea]